MDALKDHPATWATEKRASNGLQIFVGKIPDTWVIILTSLPVILMLEVRQMYGVWGFRFMEMVPLSQKWLLWTGIVINLNSQNSNSTVSPWVC